jgi:hypothetical protein
VALLPIPVTTQPGQFIPGNTVPGSPGDHSDLVIVRAVPQRFVGRGYSDNGSYYGAITTEDITIKPNPGISDSASMFLDNNAGQVYEFFCSDADQFGVFDKTNGNYILSLDRVSQGASAHFFGPPTWPVTLVTGSSYTILPTDATVLSNGPTSITLMSAGGFASGRTTTIKNIAAAGCTVHAAIGETIDGAASYSLPSQYKYVTLQSVYPNAWYVTANN